VEWGVLLTIGESMWLTELELRYDHRPEVILESGNGWYTEPHYRFDIGFIEEAGRITTFRRSSGLAAAWSPGVLRTC
jgi:hypothetical protein